MDDSGRFYSNLAELHSVQTAERAQYKLANEIWWADGGYGGCSTESAMIGDEGSAADVLEFVTLLREILREVRGKGAAAAEGGGQ